MLSNYQLSAVDNGYLNTTAVNKKVQWKLSLFIFAVFLTTAKGLRLGGDVGLGEILILAFFIASLFKKTKEVNWSLFPINNYFWYTIFFTSFLGMAVSLIFYQYDFQLPRTLLAYSLCFMMTIAVFKSRIFEENPLIAVKAYIKVLVSISFLFTLMILSNLSSIGSVNLYWLGTTRFQGWSLDPNQLAIIYIIAPFMIIYLLEHTTKVVEKVTFMFAFIIILIPALATESDSILAAWGAGGAIILAFMLFNFRGKRIMVYIKFICLIGLIGLIPLYIYSNIWAIQGFLSEMFFKDGQGMTRINIWMEKIEVIKLSPIVGVGPDMAGNTDIGSIREAHNNILQLGAGSGIIGVIAFLLYFLFVLVHVIKSKNMILLGALVSLFMFGLTHYTLRHPSFWLMLLLIDILAIKGKLDIRRVKH